MIADRRGVSEVLSFALVFAIITSSVALVYVFGFPALENQRDGERITNAERAFDILADNMADIYRRGAPSRATEIKLSEAQLATADEEEINVTGENGSTLNVGTALAGYRPIVYQSDVGTVVYENGAVIRSDEGGGAIMVREPAMLFGEDRTVLPYVQTRARSAQSVGSDTTVLIRAERSQTEVLFALEDDPPYDVTLNVTTASSRTSVWETYLEEQIDWISDPCSVVGGGTAVRCSFTTDELYVSQTTIDVSLET